MIASRQQLLTHIESRQRQLLSTPNTPARNETAHQLEADFLALKGAQGETVTEMGQLTDRARTVRNSARLLGRAAGLGLGLAAVIGTNGLGPASLGLGMMVGFIPSLVMGRFAYDLASSWADRIQPSAVGPALQRWSDYQPSRSWMDHMEGGFQALAGPGWTSNEPACRPKSDLSPLANQYIEALDLAKENLVSQPSGPARRKALAVIEQDRISLTYLPGSNLQDLTPLTERSFRRGQLGRRLGLAAGIALGCATTLAALSSGEGWLLSLIAGGSGGFLSSAVLGMVGQDIGRALAPRQDALRAAHSWKPLVTQLEQARLEAARAKSEVYSLAADPLTSLDIGLEPDGLRVGAQVIPIED